MIPRVGVNFEGDIAMPEDFAPVLSDCLQVSASVFNHSTATQVLRFGFFSANPIGQSRNKRCALIRIESNDITAGVATIGKRHSPNIADLQERC